MGELVMSVALKNVWRRFKEGMRWMVVGPRNVASKGPIPGRKCLSQDYAGCTEFSHCPNCSALEQILRTAPWMEKNWQRPQHRKDSPPHASDRVASHFDSR